LQLLQNIDIKLSECIDQLFEQAVTCEWMM